LIQIELEENVSQTSGNCRAGILDETILRAKTKQIHSSPKPSPTEENHVKLVKMHPHLHTKDNSGNYALTKSLCGNAPANAEPWNDKLDTGLEYSATWN
jgi:hypothetical protein